MKRIMRVRWKSKTMVLTTSLRTKTTTRMRRKSKTRITTSRKSKTRIMTSKDLFQICATCAVVCRFVPSFDRLFLVKCLTVCFQPNPPPLVLPHSSHFSPCLQCEESITVASVFGRRSGTQKPTPAPSRASAKPKAAARCLLCVELPSFLFLAATS
jgi:hypothetical protein